MSFSAIFDQHMQAMVEREKILAANGVRIFRLSATERQEFKECRRRWDYSSYSRQGLEPKSPAQALWFGTGIHHVLEYYYGKILQGEYPEEAEVVEAWMAWVNTEWTRIEEASGTALWEEQKKSFQAVIELGIQMLSGYVAWSSKADHMKSSGFKKVLFTEREFIVPIPDPNSPSGEPYCFQDGGGQLWEIWLVGRLDLVVEDFDGKIWCLDHKTSKDKLNPEHLLLDDQMTVYSWALQQILRTPVAGCYYNVLRKKAPTVPQVLVSGKGLSKAKSIDTTYDVYMDAILDSGFDPEDYKDILRVLADKPNTFFQREKVFRNQHELSLAGKQLALEAIDMLNAPFIYPNPTWDCIWKCDFRNLCLSTNRGDDTSFLKEALFQKREHHGDSVYSRETTENASF